MNGKKIPIYELKYGKTTYYPYYIDESNEEKTLNGLILKDLNLEKGKSFCIEYNFDNFYYFDVVIDDKIPKDINNKTIDFEVLSGKGYGIIDNKMLLNLKSLLTVKRKDCESYYLKSDKEYLQKKFDISEVNSRVNDYKKNRENQVLPKQYIFNVSLEGFNKEIKRKISVNSDILIDSFCRKVITSMNGDLSHGFDVKIGKEYLGEYYSNLELFYLSLKENLTLSKIIDGHSKNDFEVLSGKGYGIIDDCGGVWELNDIFNGVDIDWGKYNIDDFDLEKCNESISRIG